MGSNGGQKAEEMTQQNTVPMRQLFNEPLDTITAFLIIGHVASLQPLVVESRVQQTSWKTSKEILQGEKESRHG